MPEERRPHFILMLAGNTVFLFDRDKWSRGSYLQFSLDDLYFQGQIKAYRHHYALFHLLCGKEALAADGQTVLMDDLIEQRYEGTESMKGYVSLIHGGEEPQYKIVGNANEEVSQVMEWIEECRNSEIPLKDICVASLSMGFMKGLQTRMHNEGLSYRVLKGTSKQGAMDGISLCTFHSLKGLEFKVVILMGVNERNLPSKATTEYPFNGMDALDKKEYLSAKRSLLYVAITRARQLVYMVGYGQPSGLIDKKHAAL